MADLQDIIANLRSDDAKARRQAFADAEAHLDSEAVNGSDVPDLVDALLPALSHSNPMFVQGALSLLIALVEVMGEDLAPYIAGVWAPLVERLGDAKVTNRERAVDLAVALSTLVVPGGAALERLRPAWEHKNWRARESALHQFGRLLASHDSQASLGFSLKSMLPLVVKLLEDREPPVREAAYVAVEQMHRHLGQPLLNDLHRQNLRPTVLKPVLQRLGAETARDADAYGDDDEGSLPQPSPNGNGHDGHFGGANGDGTARGAPPSSRQLRPPSPSVGKRPSSGPPSARGSVPSLNGGWGSAESVAGPADSEESVTAVPIYSEKELSLEFSQIGEQLLDKADWAVRNSALRRFQAIIIGGACEYPGFTNHMKSLREPLVSQVAELRSSLVREACAALVLIAQTLREAFEPFVHEYFPSLLKQTIVTIQVIRECSNDCIHALIKYTLPTKITPRILGALSDRSASLRKNAAVYLLLLLDTAPAYAESERCPLDKFAEGILNTLKSGLTDAVSEMAGNATTASQKEALFKLQKMALCAPADAPVWAHHFEHALEAVLRAVQHADDKLREQAMGCIRDLLRSQPQRFKAFTEHVLLRLLAAGRDASRDVAVAAEEALELLLSLSDSHRCMAVLVPVVMKEGPPTLQLAVRLQSKLVPRFTQLQLLAILPQVLPPLFEAFKNPHADVRKAVVFCLVDMYMVLGEQLTPHLAVLSTSQLKLVTIYINRTAKARADRSGNSPPSGGSAAAAIS